ncbi:MAG: MOSC domain-containing protein [Acidobacteria bacterium]|nr:MOSC domain-containing protein [Acidobacteriota bacterium]MCL5289200.1 MOSC domain-containing protein [Acidobacteriota bacterium]
MATVLRLFVCPVLGHPAREVAEARAVADWGLDGCAHSRRGSKRQVLLMDSETLAEMDLHPGQVKENILTQGFDVRGLSRGQRLRIGGALLEVTIPCTPCSMFEAIRPGLEVQMRGKRGMLCRVLEAGFIRPGDRIEVLPQELASPS